jgi:dipeptidyl aminopeptidase/acylaminoacyl peptidase
VNCVVNFFGPTDLATMGEFPSDIDHNGPESPESRLIGGALSDNKDNAWHASPITYVSKDDVPFIHLHGTKDRLVPVNQSLQCDRQLKSHGVSCVLVTVKDGRHGFGGRVIDRIVRSWFETHLSGKKLSIADTTVRMTHQ